jgi:hypothetical protein
MASRNSELALGHGMSAIHCRDSTNAQPINKAP